MQKQIYLMRPTPYYSLPDTAEAFVAAINEHLDTVAPEHRATVAIDIDVEDDYGNHVAQVALTYWREETVGETAIREREAAKKKQEQDLRDAAEYARLQAKFGA